MASNTLRALVTGGAGFIGSHVVEELLRRGHEPVVLDDLSVGRIENVAPGVPVVQGDVCDPGVVADLVRSVDGVVHLAARVTIRGSVDHFVEDARTNLMGTLNVLRQVADVPEPPKLVLASSMAVYGEGLTLPIDENTPASPTSPYGISKLAAESYCLLLGRLRGLRTVALRYFNTCGPRQTPTPYVGVMTIFARRMLKGLRPVVFGDGEQVRDFVSVHDVAWATVTTLEADVDGVAVNIGTGRGTSVNQLAAELARRIDPALTPTYAPVRSEELRASVADIGRATRLLGYVPRVGVGEALDEVVAWCRAYPEAEAV